MKKIYTLIILFMLMISSVIATETRRPREQEFIRKIIDIEEMQPLHATINVCDQDGDPIAITIDDLPPGAILLGSNPLPFPPDPNECDDDPNCLGCYDDPNITSWYGADLLWTPTYEQQGQYMLHVHAVDDQGGDDWVVIIINVANKNRPPVL